MAYSTDMNQQLRDDPELNKYTANKTMLKRIGTADEQAGMVVFFLSDYANCGLLPPT
jgi:sorbose reductase